MRTETRADDGRLYPRHPRVGVGVVAVRAGRILLIRRGRPPRAGEWSIPGGLQRLGETVEAAARREMREETGLELGPLELVAVVDLIERDERGRIRRHYTLVDFAGRVTGGVARAASDAAELRWVRPAEVPRLVSWARTREVIEAAWRRLHPEADPDDAGPATGGPRT